LFPRATDRADQIYQIIESLFPFNYGITGNGIISSISAYLTYLDFQIDYFESGLTLNGWTIPRGWSCARATIESESISYDCIASSPLGCAYLSPSFSGMVSYEELLQHCSCRTDLPNAIVYDWTRLYRQKAISRWGLSIPYERIAEFPREDFKVTIECQTYDSHMPVLSYTLLGGTSDTIYLNAHNCHPFQANDDISGVATLIYLFQQLSLVKKRRYSYTLLLGPELFAPMFWLQKYPPSESASSYCLLLKSIGNSEPLQLQSSYTADSVIDRAAFVAFRDHIPQFAHPHPYRSYYGNDETVFESPGYRIPTISLTRFPFVNYHTHLDTPSSISKSSLGQTYDTLLSIIEVLETSRKAQAVKPGLFCLSSPKYNLYKRAPAPGIDEHGNTDREKQWNLLMNCLPMDLDDKLSALDVAIKYNLPYAEVSSYLRRWEDLGIVTFEHSSDQ